MKNMSPSCLRIAIGTTGWGLVLFLALCIAQLQGDWGHGICGPWGCGPPLQALVGCHLAWLVVLIPLAILSDRWLVRQDFQYLGLILTGCGFIGICGLASDQFFNWWPTASEFQRRYVMQRIGFALITQIDLPFVELVFSGVALIVQAQRTHILGRFFRNESDFSRKTEVK